MMFIEQTWYRFIIKLKYSIKYSLSLSLYAKNYLTIGNFTISLRTSVERLLDSLSRVGAPLMKFIEIAHILGLVLSHLSNYRTTKERIPSNKESKIFFRFFFPPLSHVVL